MSWSVGAIGKAGKVRESIAEQFKSATPCMEPEESVRKAASAALDEALSSFDPSFAVKVNASGSLNYKDWTAKTGISHSLQVMIEPQHNFIE